ncbi:MAG TPA: SGNH/GDSL hydrolase family protein [Spirochaetota bacterium]|nr:SGNH/GDSL hydrolase family protein [Spirochaetota bacterium]HPL16241.1 SGNH/GDSL hydrolase family protein [Spirochaetota bacterium]HQF08416.1 SGNH/GDSL hydrolase family protein [Spirochaetota bacterium]HQH99053.1 SGNH/GDSL hydrolase family protein [Spirochaetota bacterium]HQJ73031.1 SGNH/GDSL hydrolase family protein [Spirochaetota bacterium]
MKKLVVALCIVGLFLAVLGCGIANMTNPTANEFDVVIVGDSIFDLDGFIHSNLKTLSGKSYKDYSSSGDTVAYITKQYNKAIAARPTIKTIIMDGGGNDILMDVYWSQACQATSTISSACKAYINSVLDQDEALWEDMNNDGVDNIFHLGYYRLKAGVLTTLLYGGTKLNPAVVYADDQLAAACAVSPAECWFIDPRADFLGKESTYIKSDGIHPTNEGGKVLATKIYNKMKAVGAYK